MYTETVKLIRLINKLTDPEKKKTSFEVFAVLFNSSLW